MEGLEARLAKRGNRRVPGQKERWEADKDLARAAAAKDRDAAAAVAGRLKRRVEYLCRLLIGGRPEAEDYAQQSMLEILRSLHSFKGTSSASVP